MASSLMVVLQSKQPVEIALPNLIDIRAQSPPRALRPPENFTAAACEHAFQISYLCGGEDGRAEAKAIFRVQMTDACLALGEISQKVTAHMRQQAVAFAPSIEIIVKIGLHGTGDRQSSRHF